MDYAVQMKGVTKRFSRVVANDKVDLAVKEGEIHVLLGENGAGKSTLMNVLYGLYQPDEGEILIHGDPVHFKSSREAVQKGIGMVHQHFMLMKTFTVAQNIMLGSEVCRRGFLDEKKASQEIKALSEKYGLKVDPDELVSNLSVGVQQRVEILKILYRKVNIIILDEPTAVLTPLEVNELYEVLRNLKKSGHTILFITHKLQEIMDISDRVTIVRGGKKIDTVCTGEVSKEELATMMVGRKVNLVQQRAPARFGDEVLSVKDLTVKNDSGLAAVDGVSFSIRQGEVLGIAGVDGNGQRELVEAISGLRKPQGGAVFLRQKETTGNTTAQMYENSVGHIPEDRQKYGLILENSLCDNLLMGNLDNQRFSGKVAIRYNKARKRANELIADYSIKAPGCEAKASTLSGGNQQKFIVAREIDRNPELLIADQPTRGVDVGAIEFIHRKILEQRDSGKAVLLVSMELDEVLQLSDRILVMYNGKFSGELDGGETDFAKIGMLMAGVKDDG